MAGRPHPDRRDVLRASVAAAAVLLAGCSTQRSAGPPEPTAAPSSAPPRAPRTTPGAPPAAASSSAAEVTRRATLSVLCWHQLREFRPSDSAYARRLLICPPRAFRAQLDALAEDGWTTVGPDRYLEHLLTGAALPDKAVMLSFDDSQGTQVSEGLPQLVRRHMTATFFAMTVVLDKPHWFRRDDLRRLDDAGMTVAAHTYDHHRVDRYSGTDWARQLQQPRELLERVLRKPVVHFAYPYGAWNAADFPHLAAAGYRTAFQLSDRPVDVERPLYSLRRRLVASDLTGAQLVRSLAHAPA